MAIFLSVAVLGLLGLVFGLILGVAAKIFAVKEDPKIGEVRALLPGANCGACGFPGCDAMAAAMASGKAPANGCPVANSEATQKISEVLGVVAEISEKKVAKVLCKGCESKATKKFEYDGILDCKAAALIQGGDKSCAQGCLGYGTCVKACAFDAITIVDGIAVIDKEKCTACGKCITECPKSVIEFVPYKNEIIVECKNTEFGKTVKDYCTVGCIGCKICEKNCPFDAIHVENNIARIDYEKCKQCLVCTVKCPTRAISGDINKRVKANIDEDKCVGCGVCKKKCVVGAIEGELRLKHRVIEDKCVGCKECVDKCPKDAIKII